LKYILLFHTLTILLIVSCSEEAPVNLTSIPIARAGTDQLVEILDIVYLDGSLSTNSENVEYIWTFNYKPPGSTTVFSDSSAPNPTFIPDYLGFYNVQLVIKNKGMYSEPDFVTIQTIFTEQENYFPKKVGNKWKYKITDEEGNVKDTITVEVVGTTTLQNGEPASIWVYSSFSHTYYPLRDTLYFVTRGDTLVYFYDVRHPNYFNPTFAYIIPFQVGHSLLGGWWRQWEYFGRYTVLEYNSITVDIGTFPGAYKLYHTIAGFEAYDWSYSWIVPHVGLVKLDFYDGWSTGAPPINFREEYWELIWYNLVE